MAGEGVEPPAQLVHQVYSLVPIRRVPALVADIGVAPMAQAYEAREFLLHQSATILLCCNAED